MLWDLHTAVETTRCTVHALCLMANHLHLIVTPPAKDSLALFSKSFAQRYAQHRNDDRDASGKLFEERFWSEPIKTVFHLAAVTMYIDRNPIAAGITAMADSYRWSTYGLHANGRSLERRIDQLIVPSSWYLSLGRTTVARAREYERTFALYSATALAGEQQEFYRRFEGGQAYSRRLERPNRSSARENLELSRYPKKAK